jgi:hypothetical protein
MSGTAKSIKVTGNFIAVSYPLSSLLFLVWLLTTRKVMYWDGYNTLNVVIILLVIAGFLPFLLSVFIADLHTGWRIIISLLAFPLLCSSALLWMDLPYYKQVAETQFNRHKYLLAYHHSIYGEGAYEWYVFECAPGGLPCKSRLFYTDDYGEFYNDASLARLIVDDHAEEMHVVIDDELFFTVGYPSRTYIRTSRSARLEDYSFNLSRYEETKSNSVIYHLYACDGQYACTLLPIVYSLSAGEGTAADRFFVEVEGATREVRVLRQSAGGQPELIFSYGDRPHCYVAECSISDD